MLPAQGGGAGLAPPGSGCSGPSRNGSATGLGVLRATFLSLVAGCDCILSRAGLPSEGEGGSWLPGAAWRCEQPLATSSRR